METDALLTPNPRMLALARLLEFLRRPGSRPWPTPKGSAVIRLLACEYWLINDEEAALGPDASWPNRMCPATRLAVQSAAASSRLRRERAVCRALRVNRSIVSPLENSRPSAAAISMTRTLTLRDCGAGSASRPA